MLANEAYANLQWGLASLMLYLVLLGGAAGFQWLYLGDHVWQNRFQDYRALAEGLRVQLYWAIGALPAAVPDYYLRKQVGDADLRARLVQLRLCAPDAGRSRWLRTPTG